MLEFSTSAILDGLIHLGAFIIKSLALYFLLSLIAKDKFETNFFRTIMVIGALVLVKVYLPQTEWAENIVIVIAICFAVSFVLHLLLLKTSLLVACLSSLVIGGLSLGLDHVATGFSDKVVPEGPTFAEYMGLAQAAIEENKNKEGLKSTDVGLVDVMRKGLDALATMTDEEEVDAMKEGFGRGMELFAERKAWMDSLTPEEKQSYREEMAAFLAEQGIASDRYSLAAIKDVDPTNLVALACLFSELQDEDVEKEERVRSIPESLATLVANFRGVELSEKDLGMLKKFAELFAEEEIDEAITQARKDLEEAQGENKLAGTVLAALVQTECGLPADQLFSGEGGLDLLDADILKAMASSYWKKEGKDPETEWASGEDPENTPVEVVEVQITVVESAPEIVPQADPYLRISTPLGVAMIPSDPAEVGSWIAASHSLQMKGFVSLGNEIVLLRDDGKMLRNSDVWTIEHIEYAYRFRIEKIAQGKVELRADGREPIAP